MEVFFKGAAAALITALMSLILTKQDKDFALLVTMAGCCMGIFVLLSFLKPVLEFTRQLQTLGDLNGEMLDILLKAVGVGLVSELAAHVCADAGNSSLAKLLQLLGAVVMLWLSIPAFQMLLELISRILGEA